MTPKHGAMRDIPTTLDAVRRDIAARLGRAARDRRNPMQTPVVATADADVRVMVLRAYDNASRTLRFHTDSRAPKALTIREGAPVGVLFYDRGAKIQIRCRGTGRIETSGPAADAAWAQSTNFARRCYLGEGPGAASERATSGLPPEMEGVEPTEAEVLPARRNFAVLLVEIRHFDWLYLAHTGHVRAQFDGEEARWVAP